MGKYDNVDWSYWKEKYEQGMSYTAIAEELNGSVGMISKHLKDAGTTIRTKNKDTRCGDNLFDFTDPIVCYLAGWVATDGYYNAEHHYISLRQNYVEMIPVLNTLRDYFKVPKEITMYKHNSGYTGDNTSYELFITHPNMGSFMDYFGIPEKNKTFDIRFAKHLTGECLRMYIRGLIDGDGCVVSTRDKISILMANETFIRDLLEILPGGHFEWTLREDKKFPVAVWMTNQAIRVGKYIYTGYPEFAFPKKRQLALS